MTTEERLFQLRGKLRRVMNGVTSTIMRDQGIKWRYNFGASLPDLKELAVSEEKDAALAEALWKENVREMKILATMLYPVGEFSREKAMGWIDEIDHQEIAEQLVMNLLSKIPEAEEIACECFSKESRYGLIVGFLLSARLCAEGKYFSKQASETFLSTSRLIFASDFSEVAFVALEALKRFARQSEEQGTETLVAFKDYEKSDDPSKREIYHSIQFEIDLYQIESN